VIDYPPLIQLMLLTLALTDASPFYLLLPLALSSLLILPVSFLVHRYLFNTCLLITILAKMQFLNITHDGLSSRILNCF